MRSSRSRSRQKQRERATRRKQTKRQAWGRPVHINGLEWRWSYGRYYVELRPPAELLDKIAARSAHSGLPSHGGAIAGSPPRRGPSGLYPTQSVIAGSSVGEAPSGLPARASHSGLMGETPMGDSLKPRIRVFLTELTGCTWDALERSVRKKTDAHKITPAHIKTWVEVEIFAKENPIYALCELIAGGHKGRLIDLYTRSRQDGP